MRLAALALVTLAAAGCTPNIGDSCTLSTDCASDGTRVCDTSQPGGYCTILSCTGNALGSLCPDDSTCVEFYSDAPGCPYNGLSPSPYAESWCLAYCTNDSDCRGGYICVNPRLSPWDGQILDPNQNSTVCVPALVFVDGGVPTRAQGYDGSIDAVPPVCMVEGPTFDAGLNQEAGQDSGADAGKADAKADSGAKHDAGKTDAGKPDAGKDATVPKDAGLDGASTKDGEARDAAPADAGAKDGAKDAPAG